MELPKSFTSINPLQSTSVLDIIDIAKKFKNSIISNTYENKFVGLLFFEPSTRTRCSFEMAAKKLGAKTILISKEGSSSSKGESLLDTAKTLEAMGVNILVVRDTHSGVQEQLSRHLKIPVINAGDGTHEHPTQALLDLMTVLETRPSVDGMNLLIVGDILHSRVAKSNIALFKKMGANVSVCGPSTLVPKEIESLGVKIYSDLKEAIKKQDIVMTLRIQKERMSSAFIPSEKEFAARYCLTKELLQQASPNVLVMDPGPFNRGVQISSDVADGERSLILKQVENGVWLRMALLHLYLKGQK